MRVPAVLVAVVTLLSIVNTAAAGSAEAPEVTDPAGDAGPNGTPVPAGFEDLDIVAVWFEAEGVDTVDLVMQTAGPSRDRPQAVWEQQFDVKGTVYAAGYITVAGPEGFGFTSAYVCVASDVPASCIGVEGGPTGNLIRATLPKANISSPVVGDVIAIQGGRTVVLGPLAMAGLPLDTTPAGLPYVLEKGAPSTAFTTADGALARAEGGLGANDTVRPAATSGGGAAGEANAVPGASLALAAIGVALVAAARRRS